jgi:hypothetical protein
VLGTSGLLGPHPFGGLARGLTADQVTFSIR